jgi:hypothetical protein
MQVFGLNGKVRLVAGLSFALKLRIAGSVKFSDVDNGGRPMDTGDFGLLWWIKRNKVSRTNYYSPPASGSETHSSP